jgi:hypothetical protein
MNPFKHLVDFHNWLSDKDFIWWPFSFLRPARNEIMDMKLVMLMTACFGGLAFLMFTAFSVVNNLFSLDSMIVTLMACFGGFFLWFSLITKPMWNIRARKLHKKK